MYNNSQRKKINIKDDVVFFQDQPISSCKDFFSKMPMHFKRISVDLNRKFVVEYKGGQRCEVLTYQQFLNRHALELSSILGAKE